MPIVFAAFIMALAGMTWLVTYTLADHAQLHRWWWEPRIRLWREHRRYRR